MLRRADHHYQVHDQEIEEMKLVQKQAQQRVLRTKPDDDIRSSLKAHVEDAEKAWFHIAKESYLVEQGELYKSWGYDSMEQYMSEELNLQYRNMRHRLKIGKTIVDLGMTEDQVAKITEWTKFKAVRPLLEADNITTERVNEILAQARDKTVRELEQMVQDSKVDHVGGRSLTKTNIKFTLVDEQKATWDGAINRAKELTGLEQIGQIVEYIMAEWMANNDPALKEALMATLTKTA